MLFRTDLELVLPLEKSVDFGYFLEFAGDEIA
jgi:hypothetical protein